MKIECSCYECLPVKSSWKINGKKARSTEITNLIDEAANFFKTSIEIKKTGRENEGLYECTLVNDIGKIEKSTRLVMLSKPESITLTLKGKTLKRVEDITVITALEDVKLQCDAQGHPSPTITWFKDGKKLINRRDVILLQKNIKTSSGKYRCLVENKLGSISKEFQLKVQIKPFIRGAPEIFMEKENDENVRLVCDVEGSPTPRFSWNHNSKLLLNSKTHKFIEDQKILEFKSSLQTQGVYSCSGKNSLGQSILKYHIFVTGNND